MTFQLRACTLLLGSLCLSACTQPTAPTGTGPFKVTGYVLSPAKAASAALSTQALTPANWSAPHVPGQVLLTSGDISAQGLSALAGVRLEQVGDLRVAHTPSGESDAAFASRLQQSGVSAQPNYLYQALSVPNDPGFPGNAGIVFKDAPRFQTYLTRINAQAGWDALSSAGKPLSGATMAVLDTGVDLLHPELQGRLLAGRDFCSTFGNQTGCAGEDPDPSEITTGADVGHGTGVTGILGAAGNNGAGLTGLTWSGQTVLPVKVFGTDGVVSGATSASLVAGLNYAVAQGAKVVNMSLGFVGSADPALKASIDAAAKADVLLVAAAGNTPNQGLYYPASDPKVLAVGALGDNDTLACYSAQPKSGQKALDLVAPGGNAGTGTDNCYTSSPNDLLVLAPKSGYTLSAGTSEAAPQVSGAAALLRALRSDLSAQQISSILTSSAKTVAGGKLLDLGAAVPATLNYGGTSGPSVPVTPGAPKPFQVHVDALQGGAVVGSYDLSGSAATVPTRMIYSIPKLPAGTYTLKATFTAGGVSSTGQVEVNLNSDLNQNIATQ